MPVIKVWCLPDMSEDQLRDFHQAIVGAVESVSEFGLRGEDSMTVLFPNDRMKYGLGSEIIVEVDHLFESPGRAKEIFDKLARHLGTMVYEYFPTTSKVECFVSHSPTNQRSTWTQTR